MSPMRWARHAERRCRQRALAPPVLRAPPLAMRAAASSCSCSSSSGAGETTAAGSSFEQAKRMQETAAAWRAGRPAGRPAQQQPAGRAGRVCRQVPNWSGNMAKETPLACSRPSRGQQRSTSPWRRSSATAPATDCRRRCGRHFKLARQEMQQQGCAHRLHVYVVVSVFCLFGSFLRALLHAALRMFVHSDDRARQWRAVQEHGNGVAACIHTQLMPACQPQLCIASQKAALATASTLGQQHPSTGHLCVRAHAPGFGTGCAARTLPHIWHASAATVQPHGRLLCGARPARVTACPGEVSLCQRRRCACQRRQHHQLPRDWWSLAAPQRGAPFERRAAACR